MKLHHWCGEMKEMSDSDAIRYDVAYLGVPCVFVSYGCSFRSDAGPVFVVDRK